MPKEATKPRVSSFHSQTREIGLRVFTCGLNNVQLLPICGFTTFFALTSPNLMSIFLTFFLDVGHALIVDNDANMKLSSAKPLKRRKKRHAKARRTAMPQNALCLHTCSSAKTGARGSRLKTPMLASVSAYIRSYHTFSSNHPPPHQVK